MGAVELFRHPTRCADKGCGHALELVVVVDLDPVTKQLAAGLAAINERLDRIERSANKRGAQMAQEIDDVRDEIAAESAEITEIGTTVGRLVTDFETLETKIGAAGSLSDADRAELVAALDAAKANVVALQGVGASVDAADPAPAPVEPAPEPEPTPEPAPADGSGDQPPADGATA